MNGLELQERIAAGRIAVQLVDMYAKEFACVDTEMLLEALREALRLQAELGPIDDGLDLLEARFDELINE